MSLAIINGKAAPIGADSAKTILEVINAALELQNTLGHSALGALKELIAGGALSPEAERFAKALKALAAQSGEQWAEDLLTSLRDLETRDDKTQRRLSWAPKGWSVDIAPDAIKPASLSLKASAELYSEVLADGATLPASLTAAPEFEAAAKISINGALGFNAGADVGISRGNISFGLEAGTERTYSAYYSFRSHDTLAGRALASQVSLLRLPTDLDGLANAFNATSVAQLQGLIVAGDDNLGAEGGVRAAFPTQYGTIGLMLGGKLALSRGFTYTIAKGGDAQTVSIAAKSNASRTNSFEIGASYTVGLSTLAPNVAQALLDKTQEFAEAFKEIDEKSKEILERAETWLKPGALMRKEIEGRLKDLLNPADGASEAEQKRALSIARSLASLFGFSDAAGIETEAVKNEIAGHTSKLIAELVDETLGVVLGDKLALSESLKNSLTAALDDQAKAALSSEVFAKILPDLNDALKKVAERLDSTAKKKINAILGKDGEAVLEDIAEYIEKAREIVAGIVDAVSTAQSDLLTAEIAWQRERMKEQQFEYKIEFDSTVADAREKFAEIVMAPRRFGDLLAEDAPTNGVNILSLSAQRRLFKKTGPRWSIALVGVKIGGKVSKASDVLISPTSEGVIIVSGGDVRRERSLRNETRRMSFVSATGLFEAKVRGEADKPDTPLPTPSEARAKLVEVAGPRAAATIKLNFEEEDESFHAREAEKLMRRFVEAKLMRPEISELAISALRKSIQPDDDDAHGVLSISLAVPTSEVVSVLKFAHSRDEIITESIGGAPASRELILEITKNALAEHDPETADQFEKDRTLLVQKGLLPASAAPDIALESAGPRDAFSMRRRALDDVAIVASALSTGPSVDLTLETTGAASEEATAATRIKHLNDAISALKGVLKMGADIYFDMEIPAALRDPTQREAHKAFEEELEERQRKMISTAKKFLKTGTPTGGFLPFGGKAPKRTVALFAALQKIAREASDEGVTPPLVVSFTPKKNKGDKTILVSPRMS